MKTKEKNILHKMILGSQRVTQKEQGFFDGRFVERAMDLKNNYTRKKKHKKSLVDQKKPCIFVEQTTGVGSERLVSYSREERRSSLKLKYCGCKKRETRKVH